MPVPVAPLYGALGLLRSTYVGARAVARGIGTIAEKVTSPKLIDDVLRPAYTKAIKPRLQGTVENPTKFLKTAKAEEFLIKGITGAAQKGKKAYTALHEFSFGTPVAKEITGASIGIPAVYKTLSYLNNDDDEI